MEKLVTNYEGKALKILKREQTLHERGKVKPKVSIKEPVSASVS